MNNKLTRNSSFELVKILCIFGIILSHYAIHGMSGVRTYQFTFNETLLNLVSIGSVCVAIFMMMSGYFLVRSTKFSLTKFLKLLLQVLFYSLVSLTIECIVNNSINFEIVYKHFFSLIFGEQWFVGCYLLIYLFHPFINKLLNSLERKPLHILVILVLITSTVITTIFNTEFYLNRLLSMFSLYLFGAFIYLERDAKWNTKKVGMIITLLSAFIIIGLIVLLTYLASINTDIQGFALDRNSIPTIVFAFGVLIWVSNSKGFTSKTINYISSFSLGIYLIHDTDGFIREWLWKNVMKTNLYISSNYLALHLLAVALMIFFGGLLIDLIRRYALEYPLFLLIRKGSDKVNYEVK